jgi:tetratricopeptide (TPR) repeat protein
MKLESVAFAIAGVSFGLIAGWIIGSQLGTPPRAATATAAGATEFAQPPPASGQPPALVDEAKVKALLAVVERDPKNAQARSQLGDLYSEAERFADAAKWYEESHRLNPRDVAVSANLGFSYYQINEPDRALKQLEQALTIDPKHVKALFNLGVVRAFGKQDMVGATEAWRRVVEIAPESPEGLAAKMGLERIGASHPNIP